MNGAEHDTQLFAEIAKEQSTIKHKRLMVELSTNGDGDTLSGVGLNGRALELVSAILEADGDLYTDEECVETIEIIVAAWRLQSFNLRRRKR